MGVEVWSSNRAHLRGASKPHRSSPQVNMFSLKALALVLTVASLGEAHSLEKRETTVTYAKSWGEVGTSVVSAVVSIALVTLVWFAVAPIFGLTTSGDRREFEEDVDYYSGYSDQYDPYYYNYYQGRSFQSRMGSLVKSEQCR